MAEKETVAGAINEAGISTGPGERSSHGEISKDAEQRLAAELAGMRESERLVQAFLEQLPVGVALVDTQGEVRLSNEAFRRVGPWRVPSQDPEGPKRWRAWDPNGKLVEPANWPSARALRGESVTPGMEFLFTEADGRETWQRVSSVPFLDASGAIAGAISFVQDIDNQKRAEAELQKIEELVRQGVRVAGLGIFEHDHRSDKIEYSGPTREMMGFAGEEEITIPGILQHVLPEDREALGAAIRRAHDPAGDGRFEVEYRVVREGGQVRWISARSKTFFEGEGSKRRPLRTIGALLDVTERKEFQSRLERLVAERTTTLQELVGEMEHFSYTITHDLKAPLRAMKGFAEIAGMFCGECARKEAKEALGKISTAAERMECLITDALNYSRSVRQELPLTDVDTGALLRGMLDSYPELQPSRADIQVEGTLPVVLGNEAGLTQCLSNLLANAVKFVRPGEKPRIRVWAEEREGWARIWVEDKGIGISREMLPRVFDMFSRGGGGYEGTGIGLALVRKVTQRMDGRAGVESEEGKGSRFWIELKLGRVRLKPNRVDVAPAEQKGGTVLYVEDEESDAMFMRMAFARKGLESALQIVGDGRAAIEYLSGAGKYADRREYPLPSMVLLDLNLPQVSGFEVLKWMRNHPDFARTPVVVFSSSTREDDRVKALELGANEFVGKPNSAMKFSDVLERLQEKWLGSAVH